MRTSITPPQMSGQMIAYAISAVRVLMHDRPACGPSDKRVLLSSSIPLPPPPPAEKATARQDQAGQASTSDGARDRRVSVSRKSQFLG
jgi:hypothetical protein